MPKRAPPRTRQQRAVDEQRDEWDGDGKFTKDLYYLDIDGDRQRRVGLLEKYVVNRWDLAVVAGGRDRPKTGGKPPSKPPVAPPPADASQTAQKPPENGQQPTKEPPPPAGTKPKVPPGTKTPAPDEPQPLDDF